MIKESLFAAEEREAKLDKLGDVLQLMEQHVNFAALAVAINRAAPDPGRVGHTLIFRPTRLPLASEFRSYR